MKPFLTLALSLIAVASFAEKPLSKEDEAFLREANMMRLRSEGKEPCDMTTGTKAIVKGEAGCCAAGGAKSFKVYVAGNGYRFYSCPDSAGADRKAMVAKGQKCGPVQKVAKR